MSAAQERVVWREKTPDFQFKVAQKVAANEMFGFLLPTDPDLIARARWRITINPKNI
ncbi:hypothetical protein [Alteraurantiacibacter buctensis]|uniref:Uncharacterized protein n=1 Tax=Alteraurantiacibacter buctensis TaxID=1503981 RepID=A0A844YYT5_9SPHN|nr:hypothetical protein [Alteraurantiacibacter buctensis]MXO72120.1 hypothetical protein [Alteraurantiacibacter buctensis]